MDPIDKAIDTLMEDSKSTLAYAHEVIDALGYKARYIDRCASGYRVKLGMNIPPAELQDRDARNQWREKEDKKTLASIRRKLDAKGYKDVQVVMRGIDPLSGRRPAYICLIVPDKKGNWIR